MSSRKPWNDKKHKDYADKKNTLRRLAEFLKDDGYNDETCDKLWTAAACIERLEASIEKYQKMFDIEPVGAPKVTANETTTMTQAFATSPGMEVVARSMIEVLRSGPGNFWCSTITLPAGDEKYSLTIQKVGGLTPSERILELERQLHEIKKGR